jgi:uncharacterized repeat protein (TIGR01451 family)
MKTKLWLMVWPWAICGAADLVLPVGGKVSIELVFAEAAFSNTMALVAPPGAGIARLGNVTLNGCNLVPGTTFNLPGIPLLSEKRSQRGCRVQLDADLNVAGIQAFLPGTVLRFSMCAIADFAPPVCDYIWSSNPLLNVGRAGYSPEPNINFDHLRITPVRPGSFPGRIFELAWEDLPSNLSAGDFNDLVAHVRIDLDSDSDGLWDDWEDAGIDTNGDGILELNLRALGAQVMRKDIFVRYDYMDCAVLGSGCATPHSHQPDATAMAEVVNAFANAPVPNPDGSTGITLHLEPGSAVRHYDTANIPGPCAAVGPFVRSLDDVKAGTMPLNDPKRFTHRYALLAHAQTASGGASGCAELPGNDLIVTLANFGETALRQARTFMHELGHTLGLRHGGDQDTNYKPNYLSLMNYAFQIDGIPQNNGAPNRMDYSRGNNNLDETSLNEMSGIGVAGSTDNTVWTCAPPGLLDSETGGAAGPINWNCLGQSNELASGDVNGDRICIRPGANGVLDLDKNPMDPTKYLLGGDDTELIGFVHDGPNRICETTRKPGTDDVYDRDPANPAQSQQVNILTGFNDWLNLKYDFQGTPDFEDGVHTTAPPDGELDVREFLERVAPDPTITKVSPLVAVTGTNVAFTLRTGNDSATTAENLRLIDNLPPSLAFVSCVAPGGLCGGAGQNRTITYPSLTGGNELRATLTARLSCALPHGAQVANIAALTSSTPDQNLRNNVSSATLTAINPSPAISAPGAVPAVLTPPDKRMVAVTVNYGVTDNCPSPSCTLSVTCNETGCRENQDWIVTDSRRVQLRADRTPGGSGRIYAITISCRDSANAITRRTVNVSVPAAAPASSGR